MACRIRTHGCRQISCTAPKKRSLQMRTVTTARLSPRRNGLQAILVGGFVAGTLDLTQAMVLFGRRVPFGIAAGLVGRQAARSGGPGTYILGICLHFFI